MTNTLPAHIADKVRAEADRRYSDTNSGQYKKAGFEYGAAYLYSIDERPRWVKPETENDLPDTTSKKNFIIKYWPGGFNNRIEVKVATAFDMKYLLRNKFEVEYLDESPAPPAESTSSPQEGSVQSQEKAAVDLKIEFTDAFINGEELYDDQSRWLASCNSLKIVVTAPTKEQAFEEIMTSIRVMVMYANGIKANPQPAPDAGRDKEAQPGLQQQINKEYWLKVYDDLWRNAKSKYGSGNQIQDFIDIILNHYAPQPGVSDAVEAKNVTIVDCDDPGLITLVEHEAYVKDAIAFAEYVTSNGIYRSTERTAEGYKWRCDDQFYSTEDLYDIFIQSKHIKRRVE